jgi:hypothetical protein
MSLGRKIGIAVVGLLLFGNLFLTAWVYHTMTNYSTHCYIVQTTIGESTIQTGSYIDKYTCQDSPLPQEP